MNQKIKLIFAGTPEIAAPLLQSLAKDERFKVVLVITKIDKPAGRKMELTPPPVKIAAEQLGLQVFQPDEINSQESIEIIKNKSPDFIVTMAYGQIFKSELLNLPKIGCLNVHFSILPKYRGATPIQAALLNQNKETGISLLIMEEKMDTGAVYKIFPQQIEENDTSETLKKKLAEFSAENIPDILNSIANDELKAIPQDDLKASYCPKISKEDGKIDWNEDARAIHAKIRAFAGWPGTWTYFKGKRLKIITAFLDEETENIEPGKVIQQNNETCITTKKGLIRPLDVQLEGKNKQTINEFINGNPDFINSKLTSTP